MPNFESFSRRMLPLKNEPHVTIHKRGTIALNRSAFASLDSPDAVELLYDRERNIMGLRPIDPKANNSYYVRRSSPSASGPWLISAMAFTKFYDIDTSVSLRWAPYLDAGVLCVNLSAAGTAVSSNRAHNVIRDDAHVLAEPDQDRIAAASERARHSIADNPDAEESTGT